MSVLTFSFCSSSMASCLTRLMSRRRVQSTGTCSHYICSWSSTSGMTGSSPHKCHSGRTSNICLGMQDHTCQVNLDISRSHIENQWGSRKYLGWFDRYARYIFYLCLINRKWQDYVYIQCEYKSTKQKIKHLLREENKVKENKIS